MQWIFMLVGLVLGAVADETLTASLLGALLGLGLGQALRLHGLERENAALQAQLKTFTQRFEQGTATLYERLLKLEQPAATASEEPPAEPAAVAEPAPAQADPVQAASAAPAEEALDWTLDFELAEPDKPAEPAPRLQAGHPLLVEDRANRPASSSVRMYRGQRVHA